MDRAELFSRIGRFTISESALKAMDKNDIKDIYGKCVIFRAEHIYHELKFVYEAYSPHFDAVPEGEMIPEYEWFFTQGGQWIPRRTDRYTMDQVQAMIDKAVKSARVIIKERGRRWGR